MNVDMNGQFYYRNIPYNEIEEIHFDGTDIVFTFNIGKVPMKQIKQKTLKHSLIMWSLKLNNQKVE